MMRVGIVESPHIKEYGLRGVGFYAERLIENLKKIAKNVFSFEHLSYKKISETGAANFSLIHFPFFDPFFLTLPLKKTRPTVVTIHDLIPIKFPQHFPRGIQGELKWQLQKYSLKSVKAIITDSLSSKKDILEYTGFSKDNIYSIPLAADKKFKIISNPKLKEVATKYSLTKDFILYVGDLNWNKNLPGLLKAYSSLDQDLNLVIVGRAFLNKNLQERISLVNLVERLNLKSKINFLGFIPTDDLVAIYNLASVYCQPSFYEGFGMPILEAMACGCPVVLSKVASLPEIAGKAALFFNPEVNEIAKALDKVLKDQNLRRELREKGLIQSRKFSWEKTARKTLNVYKKVINKR